MGVRVLGTGAGHTAALRPPPAATATAAAAAPRLKPLGKLPPDPTMGEERGEADTEKGGVGVDDR